MSRKTVGDFMRTMDNADMAWFLTKKGVNCEDRVDCLKCYELNCPYKLMVEFLNTYVDQKVVQLS